MCDVTYYIAVLARTCVWGAVSGCAGCAVSVCWVCTLKVTATVIENVCVKLVTKARCLYRLIKACEQTADRGS